MNPIFDARKDIGELKELMLNVFMVSLKEILYTANREEFLKWGTNCCRQASLLGVSLLKVLIPEYTWQSWEGSFFDIDKDESGLPKVTPYQHAWIYGIHPSNANYNIFIDPSRSSKEPLCFFTSKNEYPEHPDYAIMKLVSKVQLPFDEYMGEREYFTGLKGTELFKVLINVMRTKTEEEVNDVI